MPRGVPNKKPVAKKRAAKTTAPATTRRRRNNPGIQDIPRSALKATVSAVRTVDGGALVTDLSTTVALARDDAMDPRQIEYAIFNGGGETPDRVAFDDQLADDGNTPETADFEHQLADGNVWDTFEEACVVAERIAKEDATTVFIAQVVAVVEIAGVVVKRAAPKF